MGAPPHIASLCLGLGGEWSLREGMGHLQEVGIEQKDSQAYPICQAAQGPPAAP